MALEQFFLPGERLLWSRETSWKDRKLIKMMMYFAGIMAAFCVLVALVLLFVPSVPRATSIMLLVVAPIHILMTGGLLYLIGFMAPITLAITDRRFFSVKTHLGKSTIHSCLLDDIKNPRLQVRRLKYTKSKFVFLFHSDAYFLPCRPNQQFLV
jgi:hypothetical protein